MMQRKISQYLFPIYLSSTLVIGIVIGFMLSNNTSSTGIFSSGNSNTIQEVSNLIKNKYVDDIGIDSINAFGIEEMLAHLDPHSVYISPQEIERVNGHLEGHFTGIGVMYNVIDDTICIIQLIKNGPAQKAGLEVGDKVIGINDSIVFKKENISEEFIRNKMRGEEGSIVALNIIRNGAKKKIDIKRSSISLPSVDAAYMLNANTGYIRLNKFAERTYEEFMQSMEKLLKAKMQNLVLDLRGNGGGYMHAATAIADEFLDGDKLIVYTQGSKSEKEEKRCRKDGIFEQGKLVVLMDETSASASEVLAGALQDWDRATIVGRRSFGKGLVQQQYNLSNGGALRLTVARYYTPLGRNIQKPYAAGKAKYMHELMDRYADGELTNGDTVIHSGPQFKTQRGNIVYGGGGITPNVFIGIDTSNEKKTLYRIYRSDAFEKFIINYYVNNKPLLQQFTSTQSFENISFTETDKNLLYNFIKKDSIALTDINATVERSIANRIKAHLAKQVINDESFYNLINKEDVVIAKALELMR